MKYRFLFWFEWGSGTVFQTDNDAANHKFGVGIIRPEHFPLTPETIEQIHSMSKWHDKSLNWDYPPDPGPWRQDECDRFNAASKQLIEVVVKELGEDFEIIYHQGPLHEDPDLDEYLKDPHGFKRK